MKKVFKIILHQIKIFLKKILPQWMFYIWHYCKAVLAAAYYGFPAKKLYVVGITGTKGKTSTANFVWSVLTAGGFKTGQLGTASIRIGDKESLNRLHMTMPSPFKIQRLLSQMLKEGCSHVVMEATSEGMKLFRHVGIKFDAAIFTNLTPEHLPSHSNNFEKYKLAKTKLFKNLSKDGLILANADSEYADYYIKFPARKKVTFGIEKGDLKAQNILENEQGVSFDLGNKHFQLFIMGRFNVYNALPSIALGQYAGLSYEQIKAGIENLKVIEGRMQKINLGQNFTVVVDYAHEKISMNLALDMARKATKGKVIVLLGAQGGGRDKSKRAAMGEAAAKKADYVICSNEDPYDDDPVAIIEEIAAAAEKFGKVRNQNLFVIEDRRQGIAKALSLASAGDFVLITGKGAEQTMLIHGEAIPWDDREVIKEELKKLVY